MEKTASSGSERTRPKRFGRRGPVAVRAMQPRAVIPHPPAPDKHRSFGRLAERFHESARTKEFKPLPQRTLTLEER